VFLLILCVCLRTGLWWCLHCTQAVVYMQPFGSCSVFVDHLHVPADWFVVVSSLYSSCCLYATIWFM
jgi:hypothetical protein